MNCWERLKCQCSSHPSSGAAYTWIVKRLSYASAPTINLLVVMSARDFLQTASASALNIQFPVAVYLCIATGKLSLPVLWTFAFWYMPTCKLSQTVLQTSAFCYIPTYKLWQTVKSSAANIHLLVLPTCELSLLRWLCAVDSTWKSSY